MTKASPSVASTASSIGKLPRRTRPVVPQAGEAGWLALRVDAAHCSSAQRLLRACRRTQLARPDAWPPPARSPRRLLLGDSPCSSGPPGSCCSGHQELEQRGLEDVRRAAVAILKAAHFLRSGHSQDSRVRGHCEVQPRPRCVNDGVDGAWSFINLPEALRDSTSCQVRSRSSWANNPGRPSGRLGPVRRDCQRSRQRPERSSAGSALRKVHSRHSALRFPGSIAFSSSSMTTGARDNALGDFLISSLIPRLAEASFPTMMIIAGRDDLEPVTQAGANTASTT